MAADSSLFHSGSQEIVIIWNNICVWINITNCILWFTSVSSLRSVLSLYYILRWRWPGWAQMVLWAGGTTSVELVAALWRKWRRGSTLWSCSLLGPLTLGCIDVWSVYSLEEATLADLLLPRSPRHQRESVSTWRLKVSFYRSYSCCT